MTQKHFIAVAAAIKATLDLQSTPEAREAVRQTAFSLAATFGDINPRFNRHTFLVACGLAAELRAEQQQAFGGAR